MLQMPLIQTAQPGQAPGAKTDPAAPTEDGGAFGQFLDAVTEQPLPAELRAELLKQVQDGVPLSQVLENLLAHVREDSELTLAPGMLPLLQAMAPQVEIPPEVLARGAAGRGSLIDGAPRAVGDIAEQGDPQADAAAEPELAAAERGEQLLAKHKALVATRVTAADAPVNSTPAVNANQIGALRSLELPAGVALPSTGAVDADGPLGQAPILSPKVGEAQWGQALAQRIVWMVGQDKQSAELRLNPAHLGPLQVKLTLHHDQASVSLLASNAAVRDAIEQALPRLRDMLGQQDVQLVQVDVGHRDQRPQGSAAGNGDDARQPAFGGAPGDERVEAEQVGETVLRMHSHGLLDAYA